MNLDQALNKILAIEGGYTNNPKDNGNWSGGKVGVGSLIGTNKGITAKALADARGVPVSSITAKDIQNLTAAEAKSIYSSNYFAKPGIDKLPSEIQATVLDMAVNAGPSRAISLLQQATGVTPDGKIGPQTVAAAKNITDDQYTQARVDFYSSLATKNPTQATFLQGWVDRAKQWATNPSNVIAPSFLENVSQTQQGMKNAGLNVSVDGKWGPNSQLAWNMLTNGDIAGIQGAGMGTSAGPNTSFDSPTATGDVRGALSDMSGAPADPGYFESLKNSLLESWDSLTNYFNAPEESQQSQIARQQAAEQQQQAVTNQNQAIQDMNARVAAIFNTAAASNTNPTSSSQPLGNFIQQGMLGPLSGTAYSNVQALQQAQQAQAGMLASEQAAAARQAEAIRQAEEAARAQAIISGNRSYTNPITGQVSYTPGMGPVSSGSSSFGGLGGGGSSGGGGMGGGTGAAGESYGGGISGISGGYSGVY